MSTTKQNNPNVDFGFHAVIPRIVRTHYPELSPLQKWFYACLKDLCGDHGTCYRTVRVLSQETGLSTGMVSESIPALHKAGLIHAEKKRRSSGGKEVWHITIVDIWKANGEAHPTKRSQNEQECSPHEHIQQNVHHMNKNVHTVNDNTPECSPHEQECSHSETEVITLSNNNIEAITEKQCSNVESASADIDAAHNPPSPPSKNDGKGTRPGKTQKSKQTEQPTLIEIPAGPPTIPANDVNWDAETIVQIVEAKRGKRYEEIVRTVKGKKYKSQRQRQLEAAQIIIDAKFTREEFVKAYDHRNDVWWIEKFNELTVEHMTKNTKNGTMRLIEELEKLAKPVNRKQNSPTSQGQTVKHGQRPEDYENSEISRNNTNHLRQLLADRRAKRDAANTKGA